MFAGRRIIAGVLRRKTEMVKGCAFMTGTDKRINGNGEKKIITESKATGRPGESLSLPSEKPDVELTPESGLTDDEAERLTAEGKANKATTESGKTPLRIAADNLFTLFNLLNVLLAIALMTVGAYRNMLFMGVVVSNTLIGTIQELRARKTVQKLRLLSESPVKVRRNGKISEIPAENAVQGDIVLLKAGDQVPADAILRGGVCSMSESLITGEQDAVDKHIGDWLYSGSFLTAGECECQLIHVGDASYINRLSRSAKKIIPPKSMLMSDLRRIVRFVSIALIPIGLLLFIKQFFILHQPAALAIPSSVAAMIGMIPEGLILLASVALAVGVVRLGRRHTLVQELYGIETLARVDMLCLDKTGTLTTGAMNLAGIEAVGNVSEDELKNKLSRFLGAVDNTPPTLAAVARVIVPGNEAGTVLLPFSSDRKNTAVSFADGKTLIVGAPTFTLGEKYAEVEEKVGSAAANGLRVLAAAECDGIICDGVVPPVTRVLGLCYISDELRREAPDCLKFFREQGVTLKIISGDDPVTVAAIARRAGLTDQSCINKARITENHEQNRGLSPVAQNPGLSPVASPVECDSFAIDISRIPDAELEAAAAKYTIFGRVTPERKQKLIADMKASGHNVAMTGDGVNDIPAMKTADCSIAMASGADAARHSAQLILLDNNFTSLPVVVSEGRRVINNIMRTASLFLVKTLYSFALGLIMIFLPAAYPFQPIQLTLVSALTIGLPSFFLALEPNSERVRSGFLKTVLSNAIPGALAVTICATISSLLVSVWPHEVCSTLATLSAGAVGLAMLLTVCLPFTRLRAALFALVCVLFAGAVAFFGKFFFLVALSAPQAGALVGLCAFGIIIVSVTYLIKKKIRKKEDYNLG